MKRYHFSPSCDTIAVPASDTINGCNILGKNSDRDITESQPLSYYPPSDNVCPGKVKCTYIEIEQVPHTYGIIGSRPWWIWGFEMGINEHGVAIGNEAEWSNIPPSEEEALLGMDLLRLGLERGSTAAEARNVIIDLLERYGQGGACKYGADAKVSAYHNSFIVSDPNEMFLLETVGKHWVYRKIKNSEGVSNIYKIGEDFDKCSEGIVDFAEKNKLHIKGQPFNFSKSFMLLNNHFLGGFPRSKWSSQKLQDKKGSIDSDYVLEILRGHYEGTFMENYWSPVSCCVPSVCMHGGEPSKTQSAATMLIEYHKSEFKELMFTYWGSMCPPCCSFMIPFYNIGYVPASLSKGKNYYDAESFWWKMQRLTTAIESDYSNYHAKVVDIKKPMERSFKERASQVEAQAETLLRKGKKEEACSLLRALTDQCLQEVENAVDKLTNEIEGERCKNPGQIYRMKMRNYYIEKVGL